MKARSQGDHEHVMVELVEALRDVALDEPPRPRPALLDRRQGGVAAPVRAEAVRMVAELRLVVCLQDLAHNVLQQFVRP
jgi:hypothetical protein